jgi:DegV family protein with EDD domain
MMRIITDSTADLDRKLTDLYNIEVLPLTVTMKDRHYKDGLEINTQQLFDYVKEFGELPVTSPVPVPEFVRAFQGEDEVVYLCISSKLSDCFQNATLAAERVGRDRIHIIDSLSMTTSTGALALRAAEMRNLGIGASDIEGRIKALAPKVRIAVLLDTLDYVYKGGRCSAVTAIIGNIFKVRPILEARPDGTISIREKVTGPRSKALQALIDGFKRDLANIDLSRVFITHTGCPQDVYWLKGELIRVGNPEEILINTAGAVVASHTGPDGVAIIYQLK